MQLPKFENDTIRAITQQAIQECLQHHTYDHASVRQWADDILENSLRTLCEIFKSYKFVAQCAIVQKLGGGMEFATVCHWDSKNDGMVIERWENESIRCIVSIYGITVL